MEERRRFTRYDIYCPVEYKKAGLAREPSITLNICEGGVLISTKKELEVNTNLIIKISLKGEEFFLRGRVVHIQKPQDQNIYNIGIEFLDSPPGFKGNFYEELEAILFYQKEYGNFTGSQISLAEASMKWYRNVRLRASPDQVPADS